MTTLDEAMLKVPIIKQEVHKKVVGMDGVIDKVLVAILANGHSSLKGVPGIGKTYLINAFAEVTDTDFRRIQMTPDLYPRDLWVVTEMTDSGQIQFEKGPVFTNFLLADEVNRTSPKVQSSLLEVMQERQVTTVKGTEKLPRPFLVFTTQNPIEQEGTYPLPEAQLDRFLLEIVLGYPSHEESVRIAKMRSDPPVLEKVMTGDELVELQDLVENEIEVSDEIVEKVVTLTELTRPENSELAKKNFYAGGSTRAPMAFVSAARALAVIRGRKYVVPQDILYLIKPVLEHRIVFDDNLTPDEYDAAFEEVIEDAVRKVFKKDELNGYRAS